MRITTLLSIHTARVLYKSASIRDEEERQEKIIQGTLLAGLWEEISWVGIWFKAGDCTRMCHWKAMRAGSKWKKTIVQYKQNVCCCCCQSGGESWSCRFPFVSPPVWKHLCFHQPDIFSLSLFIDCALHVLISLSPRFLSVHTTLTSRRPAINQQAVVRVASSWRGIVGQRPSLARRLQSGSAPQNQVQHVR